MELSSGLEKLRYSNALYYDTVGGDDLFTLGSAPNYLIKILVESTGPAKEGEKCKRANYQHNKVGKVVPLANVKGEMLRSLSVSQKNPAIIAVRPHLLIHYCIQGV